MTLTQKYTKMYSDFLTEMKKVSNYQFINLIEELDSLRVIFNSIGIDNTKIDLDLACIKQYRLGQVINNDFKQIKIDESQFVKF